MLYRSLRFEIQYCYRRVAESTLHTLLAGNEASQSYFHYIFLSSYCSPQQVLHQSS